MATTVVLKTFEQLVALTVFFEAHGITLGKHICDDWQPLVIQAIEAGVPLNATLVQILNIDYKIQEFKRGGQILRPAKQRYYKVADALDAFDPRAGGEKLRALLEELKVV